MTRRTERRRAERAANDLEARRQRLVEQRRPIPHALARDLELARRLALKVGPSRRMES